MTLPQDDLMQEAFRDYTDYYITGGIYFFCVAATIALFTYTEDDIFQHTGKKGIGFALFVKIFLSITTLLFMIMVARVCFLLFALAYTSNIIGVLVFGVLCFFGGFVLFSMVISLRSMIHPHGPKKVDKLFYRILKGVALFSLVYVPYEFMVHLQELDLQYYQRRRAAQIPEFDRDEPPDDPEVVKQKQIEALKGGFVWRQKWVGSSLIWEKIPGKPTEPIRWLSKTGRRQGDPAINTGIEDLECSECVRKERQEAINITRQIEDIRNLQDL